ADYCSDFAKVRDFYPHPPRFPELLKYAAASSDYGAERRQRVSTVLERQNRAWGASQHTLENIARLGRGAQALVTGQQVALFGGGPFAVYKALSAIKLGEQLTRAGRDCVPVFWLATEDHDFAEVSHSTLFSYNKGLVQVALEPTGAVNRPVSDIQLGEQIATLVQQAEDVLGKNEVTSLLRACYTSRET